ncbi:MAG: hypothetical protein R3202_11430, partial [Candidatus Competibacterales bacterium]|nr:hypothetical protein [Candidatus Competibacterales bacterium]
MPLSPLLAKRLRYYGLFRPLAALPLPLAYRLAGRIGRIDGRRQEGARAAIKRGLAAAFPQVPPAERAHWVERHFVMRAREILDVFTMSARTPANSTRLLRLQPGSLEVLQ